LGVAIGSESHHTRQKKQILPPVARQDDIILKSYMTMSSRGVFDEGSAFHLRWLTLTSNCTLLGQNAGIFSRYGLVLFEFFTGSRRRLGCLSWGGRDVGIFL